ncbi:ribonuclease III [Gymnopus androsaceus JB14]|uniref:Ribonuclease III n=1 Tax=Gymnopus androsaceus JB14 TaxID=1447944 RepID=A0A6A4I285_9AGAR|nr:ribonuclease III [Gymnopus androsaceus JB14]
MAANVSARLQMETTELPPLPLFKSEQIRMQVYTHRSYFGRPNHIFEDHPDDPSPDNEKLEHLGDTVLSLVVTTLMNDMFPCLRVGPSTKIRALIVGNATLADIAVRYRLTDRLRLHPAQAVTLKASPNVQADLFESYIGGLFQDQGLEVVQQWLNELLRPYARAAYRLVRAQHGLPLESSPNPPSPGSSTDSSTESSPSPSPSPSPPKITPIQAQPPSPSPFGYVNIDMTMTTIGHLALFNQHTQKSNRAVEWIYSEVNPEVDPAAQGSLQLISPNMMKGMKTTPIWSAKVIVDGECLGQGKGGTKKVARNEAAKLGLRSLGVFV